MLFTCTGIRFTSSGMLFISTGILFTCSDMLFTCLGNLFTCSGVLFTCPGMLFTGLSMLLHVYVCCLHAPVLGLYIQVCCLQVQMWCLQVQVCLFTCSDVILKNVSVRFGSDESVQACCELFHDACWVSVIVLRISFRVVLCKFVCLRMVWSRVFALTYIVSVSWVTSFWNPTFKSPSTPDASPNSLPHPRKRLTTEEHLVLFVFKEMEVATSQVTTCSIVVRLFVMQFW